MLSSILIDLKCRWLQSSIADLKENPQTFAYLRIADFLCMFKITHFLRFLKDF